MRKCPKCGTPLKPIFHGDALARWYKKKTRIILAIALIASLILNGIALYTLYIFHEYAEWKEGDGYISVVYRYNLPFWKVFFPSVAYNEIFQGNYYISKTLAEAVNLTDGWWHVTSIGFFIINIEEVKE